MHPNWAPYDSIVPNGPNWANGFKIEPNGTQNRSTGQIGGSSSIGDNVMCGIGSIIINKINICSNVTIGAGTIVTKNISKPGTYVTVGNKLRKL